MSERVKELENACDDLRRKLSQEQQVKDNFEDLLTALRSELESSHNERDNLRDEIVPQLRARVEGLEAEAADHEKLRYESSRMQQELQNLQNENTTLVNARKQLDMQTQMNRFNAIAEDPSHPSPRSSVGLTRSNSLARGSVMGAGKRPPSLALGRSGSVSKGSSFESRDALAERVKDVEQQRDALHRALKSLLERQEHQTRENEKKIKQLEMERDRALSSSPARMGYDSEVAILREEINTLRRRADEAIEQKWQCEKGLSGLKMDLDRSEQEIGSLRSLLLEKDILIPAGLSQTNGERPGSAQVTSASLEKAYADLQSAYAESLDRVKALEMSSNDEETVSALTQLQQSLTSAVSDRDFAQSQAEAYRSQVDHLQDSERVHLQSEVMQADELRASSRRVEDLASQVGTQLEANAALRARLAAAVDRGEQEQKANAARIIHLQGRLKSLEDKLMAAQQASEEAIARHEEEIKDLRESHSTQLLRVKALASPRSFAPKSPLSPLFAGASRSPRLDFTSSGPGMSVSESSKTDFLKRKVIELEAALADADREMEEVVGKMNIAQIEVMELQNEREEAMRATRRLQAIVVQEKGTLL